MTPTFYLLIDTCSLRHLVSKIEVSPELKQFELWIRRGDLVLLCPDVLKEEWQEHRIQQIEDVKKSLEKRAKQDNLFSRELTNHQIQSAMSTLLSQVHIVDQLLAQGIQIQTSEAVKAKIVDRQVKRRPPFHQKRDSVKDALLIFATLDYLKNNGAKVFLFLSDNYTDFAAAGDRSILHPDILAGYEEIEVKYFNKPAQAVSYIAATYNLEICQADVTESRYLPINDLHIDKHAPIDAQMEQFISKRYEELNFYPPQFFASEFPFKSGSDGFTDYSLFTLYTNNKELIAYLRREVHEEELNSQSNKSKVLKHLNRNLIFSVKLFSKDDLVDIRIREDYECRCPTCTYWTLQWNTLHLNLVNSDDDDEVVLLKKGYVLYQFGNFIRAIKVFKRLKEQALKNRRSVFYFFACFNLSKLKILAGNHSYGHPELRKELASISSEIGIDDVIRHFDEVRSPRLIELLSANEFYQQALAKIGKITREIIDSRQLQVEGGVSSNSQVGSLINAYASFEALLSENFLVYDSFTEFDDLSELFIEGIIASHSIPDSQGSKLSHFDDYIIKRFCLFGKPDSIIRYLNRYKVNNVKYLCSAEVSQTFEKFCEDFLEGFNLQCYDEGYKNYFLIRKHNRLYSNICIMLRCTDVAKDFKLKMVDKLANFVSTQPHLRDDSMVHLRNLLWDMSDHLSPTSIARYGVMFTEDMRFQNEQSLRLLSHFFLKCKRSFDEHMFRKVMDATLTDKRPTRISKSQIVDFFECANENHQAEIKKAIQSLLCENFDFELYYRSVISGIIEIKPQEIDKFTESAMPSEGSLSFRSYFIDPDQNRSERLNMLMNLYFKLGKTLEEPYRTTVESFDPYYKWLLNLDDFDEDAFNPYWITEYFTKYYKHRFRQSKSLKRQLKKFLKENKNEKILRMYYNIYVE